MGHSGTRALARGPGIQGPPNMAYYVYLLAAKRNGTFYLGVTNDLVRRVYQHKNKIVRGFTQRYNVGRLVWFETYDIPRMPLHAEKRSRNGAALGNCDSLNNRIRSGAISTSKSRNSLVTLDSGLARFARAPE